MSNQDPKRLEIIDLYRNQKPIYEDVNLTLVRLESLTRNGLNKLDKNDALVIIPIAPIEAHGNFLPIGSDYIESILMVELIKETLKEERSNNHYTIVEAPGIPIGTGALRAVEGTLDIGHRAFRNCVIDFIDGLVIAASFMVNFNIGITAALAIALHEIPQEIGDFGILVYSGFDKNRALYLNYISATTVVIGGIVGFLLHSWIGGSIAILLPFAAGNFIYIASTDLIPEIRFKQSIVNTLTRFIVFLVGVGLMITIRFISQS